MEEILKLIGAIASLFALYKIIVDVVLARSSKHREEYQFSKEYLKDLNDENIHFFVLEKGFLALTGGNYSVPEIKHLLSYANPSKAISYRSSSENFVEFDGDNSSYMWKGKYKKGIIRRIAPAWFMGCYIATASLAISPVYLKSVEVIKNVPVVVFCVSLGIVAVACLISFEDFKMAKKLMDEE
jgi:hypothetical protein